MLLQPELTGVIKKGKKSQDKFEAGRFVENQFVSDCFCHYIGAIVILSALFTDEH